MANGDDECFNQFYEKQCHSFNSPFHISSALLICYLQSDPRSHYLRVLALTCPFMEYFASPTPNFHLVRAVRFLLKV